MKNVRINLGDEPTTPVIEKSEVRVFDGPGRGRKQCDSCGIYIGVRTKKCACGHVFTRKKKLRVEVKKKVTRTGVAPEEEVTEVETVADTKVRMPSGYKNNVIAPAGKCPYPLKSTDKEAVIAWTNKLREFGAERGDYFSTSAIQYYARYFYDIFSDEYKQVAAIVEELDAV